MDDAEQRGEQPGSGSEADTRNAADTRAGSERGARRVHLLNATLSGLPELEHFPTQASRQEALHRIGAEAGEGNFLDLLKGIVAVVGAAVMVGFLAQLGARGLSWPRWLVDVISWTAGAAAAWGVLRFLHRHGFQRPLRDKLVAQGVPICRGCGYLLHGLAHASCCPECGRALDADVRELLDAATATGASRAATSESPRR